jgi:hypothetical protein
VTKESACLQGYERLGILADHVGMCKCSGRDDPIYVAIVGKLKEWVAEIKKRDHPIPAETVSITKFNANPEELIIVAGTQKCSESNLLRHQSWFSTWAVDLRG